MSAVNAIDARMQDNLDMLRLLPKHVTARDYSAVDGAWPEYRFLSLMERTRLFAMNYCDRYRSTFGLLLCWDFEPSSGDFATLWKMRKSADIWGLPYSVYLDISFHLYRNQKYADRLALPNTVFAQREDSVTWKKRYLSVWKERRYAEYARLKGMPQLWLENDQGLPAQLAFRTRLIGLAKHEGRFAYLADTFSIRNKTILLDDILSGMTDSSERAELKSSILNMSSTSGMPMNNTPAMPPGALLQTCFGSQRVPKDDTSPCSACAHQRGCAIAANKLATASYRSYVPI